MPCTRSKLTFEHYEKTKVICAWSTSKDLQVKTTVQTLGQKIKKICLAFKCQKYKEIQSLNTSMENGQNCVFMVRTPMCSIPTHIGLKN